MLRQHFLTLLRYQCKVVLLPKFNIQKRGHQYINDLYFATLTLIHYATYTCQMQYKTCTYNERTVSECVVNSLS